MEIGNKFFKTIYDEDIIYHYTKASTAIDYIFNNNELLFRQARKSNDPIESRKADRRISYFGAEVNKVTTQQQVQDENELHNFAENMEERFHQICFCQNRMREDFASENFTSTFAGKEELFGFTKLRMWDQYADKFSGVCIAFSKKKILSQNIKKFDIIESNVEYLTFQDLLLKKPGDIQGNHLVKVGKEKYKEQLEKSVKESFFYKHIDYENETEYRIGTLYDKEKCSFEIIRGEYFFDKSMKLDITGCVKAIFISSFANDRQKNDLLEFARKYDVEIVEMDWQYNSFIPVDFRNWQEFLKDLQ
jgi:hypothetical protein